MAEPVLEPIPRTPDQVRILELEQEARDLRSMLDTDICDRWRRCLNLRLRQEERKKQYGTIPSIL